MDRPVKRRNFSPNANTWRLMMPQSDYARELGKRIFIL